MSSLILNNKEFTFIKHRLRGGKVYANADRTEYLRIGERQENAEEQIHTVSLSSKGFPVARVLSDGEYEDKRYFIEESLGEKPIGHMFADQYAMQGAIDEATFQQLLVLIEKYAGASFGDRNRHRKSESLREIAKFDDVKTQFNVDQDKFETAMLKAEVRLEKLPAGMLNTDLGPYNIMPKGIIDFEFMHIGPLGYDLVTALLPGYFFPKIDGYFHKLTYEFTGTQIKEYLDCIDRVVVSHRLDKPSNFIDDFIFIKTIWLAARPLGYEHKPYDNPDRERFWSSFRANILDHVIESYLAGESLNFTNFPVIGVGESG